MNFIMQNVIRSDKVFFLTISLWHCQQNDSDQIYIYWQISRLIYTLD